MSLLASLAAAAFMAAPATAAEVDAVHVFKSVHGGGAKPQGALLQTGDGALWGATSVGGLSDDGTIFRMTTDGQFETIARPPLSVARRPVGDLVQVADGDLFGVATSGGDHDTGSIFVIDGTELSLVYSFDPGWGSHPTGGMILASDGKLYGVLPQGSTANAVVYSFDPDTLQWAAVGLLPRSCDGYGPRLVQAPDGDFYGVASGIQSGCIYRVDRKGASKIVYAFGKGMVPGGVVVAGDGTLYATKSQADTNSPCGSILRVSTDGTVTNLFRYRCGSRAGAYPLPGLILASDGLLHGSAFHRRKDGTVFYTVWQIGTDGSGFSETRMGHAKGDGTHTPIQASDGNLYATAPGGKYGKGTLVRVTP